MRVVTAVQELPRDVARLPRHGRLRVPAGESGRRGPGLVVASLSPTADLVDEVTRWAALLEVRLREHLDDRAAVVAPRGTPTSTGADLDAAVTWLVSRRAALLAWDSRVAQLGVQVDGQAEAEVAGEQALRWRRRLSRAAGLDRLVHRLVMPCPRCDMKTLIRHDGDERIRCATCRAEWTEDRYRLLARIYAELVEGGTRED